MASQTSCVCMLQVYASYRYRRDLADAAKISGVFGRSRILKREEAIRQEVSMPNTTRLCPLQIVLQIEASLWCQCQVPLLASRTSLT